MVSYTPCYAGDTDPSSRTGPLDTNILLRLSLSGGPYDEMVVSAVGRLVAAGATLFYTFQNAAEFWNVYTRPRERNGLGVPTPVT